LKFIEESMGIKSWGDIIGYCKWKTGTF
jgi:hypothetical protein